MEANERPPEPVTDTSGIFRLLAITHGQWGERIAENIHDHAPSDWRVETWSAPRVLPQVIDEPEIFLPATFPPADLVLALGEVPGLAQLIPEIARRSGARAVIAPIDRNPSLPPGLAGQLKTWLEKMDVAVAFPRPFCSLDEESYNRTPLTTTYQHPHIRRFAAQFGKPAFGVEVTGGKISKVEVERDSACGCGRYVAEQLVGTAVDDSIDRAGMLHHHFPCLASMNVDPEYNDTLMHVSGNILKDSIKEQVRGHLTPTPYLRPHGLTEKEQDQVPSSARGSNPGPGSTQE